MVAKPQGPAASSVNPAAEALSFIAGFSDYRGLKPFAAADSSFAVDRCARYVSDAECIVSILGIAFRDAATLGESSELDSVSPQIISGALEGVGSLLSMASLLLANSPADAVD